jgi:hypothetical protein
MLEQNRLFAHEEYISRCSLAPIPCRDCFTYSQAYYQGDTKCNSNLLLMSLRYVCLDYYVQG